MNKKGFTLLEILLVIASIGIIASIVVVAINPLRQIGKARNASRYANINTIQKALDQYYIANGRYPVTVLNGIYGEVCDTGKETEGGGTDCTGKIDLRELVPIYIAEIPKDPQGGGYKVAINSENNKVSLVADKASLNQEISINPIILTAGFQDPMFDTGTGISIGFDGGVWTTVSQNDEKVVVGGNFTNYQGVSANKIIRLNSDGSRDTSFDIGTGFDTSWVFSLAIQTDGKIIVGGGFTSYQGVGANGIIRLNSDGSRDTSFDIGSGFDDQVRYIMIQSDGKILVGGRFFTSYQGVGANGIIRLNSDGSRDTSFDMGTGFNSQINSIKIQNDDKILVGGNFTSYQGVSVNRIIRLNSDGSIDTSFDIGAGFDNEVRDIEIQSDGQIIAGGLFTSYQGIGVNRIIMLNSDGSQDTSFDIGTGFDNRVWTIAIQSDGQIIAGGDFTSYQGVGANRIIRLNSDGSRDTSFDMGTGFDYRIYTIEIQSDEKLIAGGDFRKYQGEDIVNKIIRLDSDGSRDIIFNTSTISDIGTGFNAGVRKTVLQNYGKVIVGGQFTSYKGVGANRIIRLNSDGSRDTSFDIGTGFDNDVYSVLIQSNGKFIVGGWFTNYKGVSANGIIRLNDDGSRDTSFDIGTGFDNNLWDVVIQNDGKVIVVGEFTNYQGVGASRIIRLNSDGSRDNSFDIGSGFNTVAIAPLIQSDGKIIIGGEFTNYQGVGASRIIRLNSDGSRDNSFDMGTGFNDWVHTLTIQSDGKIIVGGNFIDYQGVGASRIIRLNSDGSRDTSFDIDSGFNDWVLITLIESDGKVVVGGNFTNYKDNPVGPIIKLKL